MIEKKFEKNKEQTVDILEIFEKPLTNEAPENLSILANDRSLNLDHTNSLALMARHSIQNGLPIPKIMLSYSEDAFYPQAEQYQQKSPDESYFQRQVAQQQLINQLNLDRLVEDKPEKQSAQNTKNVLRNFGNAQNHFILYHRKARQYLEKKLSNVKFFDQWVRALKLENFQNFKKVWSGQDAKIYTKVYKRLCWEFYTQNAIPYVLSSRIKKSHTRISHLRYIYRFLQGLKNPQQFTHFKKQ